MDAEIKEYLSSLSLFDREWFGNDVECKGDICLAVVKSVNGYVSLEVVKHSMFDSEDKHNTWMSADDLGWCGPVRFVVAWSLIS